MASHLPFAASLPFYPLSLSLELYLQKTEIVLVGSRGIKVGEDIMYFIAILASVYSPSGSNLVMILKNSNCDETQRTQIVMKLKNSNFNEPQKLKL